MRVTGVRLENFLTYGEPSTHLSDLQDLNVFVGPNGSGKTNILRAIETVSISLNFGSCPWQSLVHRRAMLKRAGVEVEVKFCPEEIEALATTLEISLTSDQRNPGDWKVPFPTSHRLVRKILFASPRPLRTLFEGPAAFKVESDPDHQGPPTLAVELKNPAGSIFVGSGRVMTSVPPPSTGWGLTYLADELGKELESYKPGCLTAGAIPPEISPAEFERVAAKITPDWLRSRIPLRDDGLPVTFNTEDFYVGLGQEGIQHPTDRDETTRLLRLAQFLRSRGYSRQTVNPFAVLANVFSSTVVRLADVRSRPSSSTLPSRVPEATQFSPAVITGEDLAADLFSLSTSPDLELRQAYASLQAAFRRFTKVDVEAVLEEKSVPSQVSPQGVPTEYAIERVPSLRFIEKSGGSFQFGIEYAAAGFIELLTVLYASFAPTDSAILLDEPALNLHPNKQAELYSGLRENASRNRNQLFIVTHSSSFVAPADMIEARRCVLEGDQTVVRSIHVETARERAQILKDADRYPQLLSCLFARAVILLEGDDEEAALPLWFRKLPGGELIGSRNVKFLAVHSDSAFGKFASTLDRWGVPYRILADGNARERVSRFGEYAKCYDEPDLADLMELYCRSQFQTALVEVGGAGRERRKDPAVARAVALESDPPPPIQALWTYLRSFVELVD